MSKSSPLVKRNVWVFVLIIGFIGVVILLTAALIPQQLHPAYAAAVAFVNAAGRGDDETALKHLSPELQTYIATNCPNGSVAACIDAYTPSDWGNFMSGVFRRAQPDGTNAWDILLISTYELGQGFSGVCIYNRAERVADAWYIVRWSGWISCDEPNSGLSALMVADAPNHAP